MTDFIKTHPPTIEMWIEKYLNLDLQKLNNSELKKISQSILRLSDFYIDYPDSQTPWDQAWAELATLVYYFPLNRARNLGVIKRGLELGFFQDLTHVIDFGAGLGAATSALQDEQFSKALNNLRHFELIEKSPAAQKLLKNLGVNYPQSLWKNQIFDLELFKNKNQTTNSFASAETTLVVFSYSLTELTELPDWSMSAEALMILEPSTQQDGRRLLSLRQKLIDSGFNIWAPCTHQGCCPLIKHSQKDWCHDRFHLQRPDWFLKIEAELPFQNPTVTTSYLLARRKPLKKDFSKTIRTVGDVLKEKGKMRQMICRGESREFLSWLDRDGGCPQWPRGDLVPWPEHTETKGHEIRIKK